jgi:anti-sigma regulatory factor (Ser/Thr protein kinase)
MEDDFFTAINVEIDHESMRMKYVSAGHPPFLLFRGNQVMLLPEIGGPGANLPIGIIDNEKYSAGEIRLMPGDRVIFYTDGLTEMTENKLERSISPAELVTIAQEMILQQPKLKAVDIIRNLLERIMEISGETVIPAMENTSGDDVTLVCFEIENSADFREYRTVPRNTVDALRIVNHLYKDIAAELEKQGFEEIEARFWPVLEEGILNAWKHGNHQNPEKSVYVRWRYGNDFHLQIMDEGEGFDLSDVCDPTLTENLTKSSGRGLFMIKYYSSCARWESGGSHLITYFKKRPDPLADEQIRRAERFMKLWEMN